MQQGDIGAAIRFELLDGSEPFVLDDDSIVQLWIRQPSGRLLQREFDVVDPDTGLVYYATVSGDLAEWGKYRFQARAVMADGRRIAFETVDRDIASNVFPVATHVLPSAVRVRIGLPEISVS
jgi:hypothetical protein